MSSSGVVTAGAFGSDCRDEDETMFAKVFVAAEALDDTDGPNMDWDEVLDEPKGETAGTAGLSFGAPGG